MKRASIFIISAIALALAALYLWPAPAPNSHIYFDDAAGPRVEIIAHGGGLGHAPANTLLALQRAREMGADVLEVDVQQTSDGVLILRHDDTLERTTNMTGVIAELTWRDIEGADASAGAIPGGVLIPQLDEAFAAFPSERWILEIKNDTDRAALAMCDSIKRAGAEARVLVGSFHDAAMARFRTACPAVATSMASGEARRFVTAARLGLSRFVATPAVAMQLPPEAGGVDLVHPRLIAAAKERGLKLQYWTINDPADMQTLLAAGADGIITDYVDRGRAALAAHSSSDA